jgi:hypothetical protein
MDAKEFKNIYGKEDTLKDHQFFKEFPLRPKLIIDWARHISKERSLDAIVQE